MSMFTFEKSSLSIGSDKTIFISPHNLKCRLGFHDDKWKPFIHSSTERFARGTWRASKDDPTHYCGFRRYGVSNFCLVLMV